MDLSRMGVGELIAAISGAVLIVVMFLPWWSGPQTIEGVPLGEIAGLDSSLTAWQAATFNDIIWFATGAAAVVLGLLAATQSRPNLPIAWSAIVTALGILALILIVVRLVNPPGTLGRDFGVWLGLLAILGVVYGGWRAMGEEDGRTAA